MYNELKQEIKHKRTNALSNMRAAMEGRGCSEKEIESKLHEIDHQYDLRLQKLKQVEVSRKLMNRSWGEM